MWLQCFYSLLELTHKMGLEGIDMNGIDELLFQSMNNLQNIAEKFDPSKHRFEAVVEKETDRLGCLAMVSGDERLYIHFLQNSPALILKSLLKGGASREMRRAVSKLNDAIGLVAWEGQAPGAGAVLLKHLKLRAAEIRLHAANAVLRAYCAELRLYRYGR